MGCRKRQGIRVYGRSAACCALISIGMVVSSFFLEEHETAGLALLFSGAVGGSVAFGCVFWAHCFDGATPQAQVVVNMPADGLNAV